MGEAAAQGLGGHVDEFDLVGAADDVVGDGLALFDAGDRFDDVVEGFQVLDVDGGDDVDTGLEEGVDVLPALVVAGAGHVGVGDLVDQHLFGPARQDGVEVHLGERLAAVVDPAAGNELEPLGHLLGQDPAMAFDQAHHDIGAPISPSMTLTEHRVGLTHTRRRTQIHPQMSPSRGQLAGAACHTCHCPPVILRRCPVTALATHVRQIGVCTPPPAL